MRTLRSRCFKKNVAIFLVTSFFLNLPVSMLDARTAQNNAKSTINLEYSSLATLKPMLTKMAQDPYATADVLACNNALKKGQSAVSVDALIKALPEVIFNVFNSKVAFERSVKTEADLSKSEVAKDVMSALRALKLIKSELESLKTNSVMQNSRDFQVVLQALQDMLAEMPEDNNDDVVNYVRFLSSTTDLGIRQILVAMVGCIDTIDSKLDVINIELVDCCVTVNSKLDKVDEDVLACCFTLESKIDEINTSGDFGPCCFTLNSKIDGVEANLANLNGLVADCCFTLASKVDNIPTNDFATCCSTLENLIVTVDQDLFTCCSNVETLVVDCCFTLGSKIDQIPTNGFATCCSTLENLIVSVNSNLSTCCSTLENLVETVDQDLFTCCSNVETLIVDCCFTLGSKIDNIPSNNFATCCSVLENLIEAVDQDLFTCCSTLESLAVNSKFTVSSQLDGIEICCFNVNSKTDIILADIVGSNTTVGNVLDKSSDLCCFTGTCDIDNANLSVISWLKTIYRDLRGFTTASPSDCTAGSCAPAVCS